MRIVNTHIKKEDKVTVAGLKKALATYPIGTYLRYAKAGRPINEISDLVWGRVKIKENEWAPYSSFRGLMLDVPRKTDAEVLHHIDSNKIRNIGVKLPS